MNQINDSECVPMEVDDEIYPENAVKPSPPPPPHSPPQTRRLTADNLQKINQIPDADQLCLMEVYELDDDAATEPWDSADDDLYR